MDQEEYIQELQDEIDSLKKENRNLKREKNRFSLILDSIGDAIITTDAKGNIENMNPLAEDLTGWEESEAKGKQLDKVFNIINTQSEEVVKNPAEKVLEEGKLIGLGNDTRLISREGKEYQIADSAAPIKNSEGEVSGVVVVFRDITEKYRLRKKIKNRMQKYEALFNQSLDGIHLHDKQGNIIEVNNVAVRQSGYSKEELLNMSIFDLHPEFQSEEKVLSKKKILTQWQEWEPDEAVTLETYHQHKDGKKYPVEVKTGKVHLGEKELMLAVVRDISARKKAEQQLKQSKTHLEMTLNSIGDAVISTDTEGKILRMNPVAENLTGWKVENAKGQAIEKVFKIVNTHTREEVKNPVKEVLEKGEIIGLANHTLLISKEGQEYPIADSAAPIKSGEGEIRGVVLVFRDITEKYEMRQKLRKNEEKYRTVFENTGTATVIIEEDTTIALVNRKFEELSGYSREEIEGKKSWTEFVVEDDLERLRDYHNRRIEDGKEAPNKYEFKFIDKNNNIHNIILTEESIPNTDKYVSSLTDITEKKKVEKQLKESEEEYRRLVEATGDIILAHDRNGIIKFANRSAFEYSGYTREELIGKNIIELVPENEKEDLLERKNLRIEEGFKDRFHFESIILSKNNERIEVDVQTTPHLKKGKYKGELIIARDISDRKKAEKEKKKLRKQLYQKQKLESIGTLAGGIAHDFNNLLTVILGMSDLAFNQTDESKAKSSIEEIRKAGEKAAKLTDQLLLFSREKDTEFEIINLNQVINDLEKMLNRLIGEDIVIHDQFEQDIWKIQADKGQIEQVLTNLIINARDAMPEGGDIFIKTQNMSIDNKKAKLNQDIQEGRYVVLEVEDTGTGMEKDVQEKIFDPFFTTKDRSEGTGMGLSVVHGIIKSHKGIINVYSEPGKGTTFKLYFPAVVDRSKKEEEIQKDINIDQYTGNGETVLIVEDEKSVRNYLENILPMYNYVFFSAKNAEEALEIFDNEKSNIDILISDIILPGINGQELADKLKQEKEELDIILSSGYSDERISQAEMAEKGYAFVKKPYDLEKLLKTMDEII